MIPLNSDDMVSARTRMSSIGSDKITPGSEESAREWLGTATAGDTAAFNNFGFDVTKDVLMVVI